MSIDAEINAVKAAAEAKLRRLRERERREQRRLDSRVLGLLRERYPSAAEGLDVEAREQLAAEKAARSARAKASRVARGGSASRISGAESRGMRDDGGVS